MTNEEFKKIVSKNLIYYRKLHGYTQLQLAEATFYSDKAISKWERGESLPEAYVLNKLADFYGITLNDLLVKERVIKVSPKRRAKTFITLISFVGVWLFFAIAFTLLNTFLSNHALSDHYWLMFIYAIPVSFLVVYILSCIWFKDTPVPLIAVTITTWTIGVSIYLSLSSMWVYSWLIFVVLIFVQIIIVLVHWLINVHIQTSMGTWPWFKTVVKNFGNYLSKKFSKKKKKDPDEELCDEETTTQ